MNATTEVGRWLGGATGIAAARLLARPDAMLQRALDASGVDAARLIVDMYERGAVESAPRRKTGVFYTPEHVVEAMLDRLPAGGVWLDPAAGAGAFLVAIARRHGVEVLTRLHAADIDGHALDAAALALEAVLGRESQSAVARWRKRNAHVIDFLRDEVPFAPDVIVGNPPYGTITDPALAARFPMLRGETDMYALFVARATQVVRPGGTVSLLVPDTWLTNAHARAFRSHLAQAGMARILDFGKPFASARDTRVHALSIRAGAGRCEVESQSDTGIVRMADMPADALARTAQRGWFVYRTPAESEACAVIEKGPRLGDRFDVIYGLRTGDNDTHVCAGPGAVPLVGGRDLEAYDRHVQPKHLVNPDLFRTNLRRQIGRMKLGIQRIRTNSKLSWRRWVEAAPLESNEVGLDSLTLIASPDEEALWALLGVLNSSIFNRWYRLTFTDVNVKPTYLAEIPLPSLDSRLARLAKRRVEIGPDPILERAVDRVVAEAWGLDAGQSRCLEEGFWGTRLPDVPWPSHDAISRLDVRRSTG